ncbi:MAG: lipid-A-disaccharide synthase [Gammaproteobacteria bacterium]|jgi:lipid-A-disaccharide synthase|nr:lipid-A-disaccharide synthase [Gammaproteobacteria bacterium]
MPLRVGLVAGEASGDTLGAGLIHALRRLAPDAEFFGVAGPKMRAAGCEVWEPSESLAVMGLFEILRDLPRLLRLLGRLRRSFIDARPDVFVGIDAPDTNLRLARHLHAAGIPTVQYVSPQVWAWRQSRVHSIRKSIDLVLCLLPFEKRFYDEQHVAAEFVGHPLADAIPLNVDRSQARADLDLPADAQIVALLPGSRRGEVTRLAGDFARTAQWLAAQRPELEFVAPMANALVADVFAAALERLAPLVKVRLLDGHAQAALIAADVVLVASGTASLEAALCKRPMVVVYRLGAMTVWVLKRLNLVKSKFFAQPNLLADRRVVGEYFQAEIVPESIGAELLMWLDETPRREALLQEFLRVHVSLKRDASARAAQAVFALANRRPADRGPA